MRLYGVLVIPVLLSATSVFGSEALDTATIERLVGVKGTLSDKEGVLKVSFPRTDLAVNVAGVRLTPPMGLTSWAAFTRVGSQAMVMGDTVLLEDQVNPVLSVALESGLEVTALHNHFFWETPRVMFMHLSGVGDEAGLATAVAKVWAKLRETSGGKGVVLGADIDPAQSNLEVKALDAAFGRNGNFQNGVYRVVVGRDTTLHGHAMGDAMGMNTWAAFAGADDNALVDGDFVVFENELQPVLKSLRKSRINIVAIHHHMVGETPRTIFLHYWGRGSATALAEGVKAALGQTAH